MLKGDIGSVAEDFFPLMEGDGVLTKEEVIRFIEKEGKWSLFCMVLFGIIPFFFKAVNVFDKHKVLQKWIVGWFVFLGLLLSWQKADIMLLGQWFVPMLGIFAAFRWWRPRVKKEKLLKKKIFKTCFGACPFALLVFILLASVFWMGILSVLFFAICLAEEEGVSDGWWNDWTSGTGFGSGGLGGFGGFGGGGFGGGGAGGGW